MRLMFFEHLVESQSLRLTFDWRDIATFLHFDTFCVISFFGLVFGKVARMLFL